MAFTTSNLYVSANAEFSYNTADSDNTSIGIGPAVLRNTVWINEEFEEFTEVSEVLKSSPKKKKKIDVRKLNKSLLNL